MVNEIATNLFVQYFDSYETHNFWTFVWILFDGLDSESHRSFIKVAMV